MRWLRLKIFRGARSHRHRLREWLEDHPRISRVLERGGCLHVDEYTIARGIAVGLFIGLTPTVGIQTILMIGASLTFRANFIAAYIVSFISNPLTMAPLYYGFSQLGELLLRHAPLQPSQVEGLGEEIAQETLELVVGSLAIAGPMAIIGYLVFLRLWQVLQIRRLFPLERDRRQRSSGSAAGNGKTDEARPDENG